jgi:hypothetical protein
VSEVDDTIARAQDILRRHSDNRSDKRARERQRKSVATRLARVGWVASAIVFAAFVIGLFLPIGTTGVMIAVALFLLATFGIMLMPGAPEPSADVLPTTQLALLPLKTEEWLATQRLALPAPAARLADGIGVKLEALAPQLQALDEREPAAAAVRRLIGDELPELVKGYRRVPEALRQVDTDGIMPERQLVEGLKVVDQELTRMSEQLARGDLEKLATQGKYLELKYQGDTLGS